MIPRDDLDSLWNFISSKSFTQADCFALNEPRSETDLGICSIECSWTRNVWQEKLQQISVNSECLFLFEAKDAAPFFCSTVLLCVSRVVSRKKSITVAAPTSALTLPGNGFDFRIQAILFCVQSEEKRKLKIMPSQATSWTLLFVKEKGKDLLVFTLCVNSSAVASWSKVDET